MLRKNLAIAAIAAVTAFTGTMGSAWADPDNGLNNGHKLHRKSSSAELEAHDRATANIISSGPTAKVTKNLAPTGRGIRNAPNATTDVWAHAGYAYTGTFSNPCGGDAAGEAGVWVWDVQNKHKAAFVGVIKSPTGSRVNDVKAAAMNSGNILVHSNERCGANGVGGFEIYNVDDPTQPVFLSHVQVDEINPISDALFGGLTDNGVHNLFLFKQGARDFVAAQSEGAFDGFQIFEITDPANPVLISGWGAEEVFDSGVGDLTDAADPVAFNRVLDAARWLLDGFGASRNRFLHDFTISADGTKAYLAHWDAGLILLDISDVANPTLVSVAIDPVNGSLDGEVNSHSVWPSEDGKIVIEGEEDFSAWEASSPPGNVTFANLNLIPGVIVSTSAGDAFEANQIGDAGSVTAGAVTVDTGNLAGQLFAANEFGGNNHPLGAGTVSGNFVWIGRACNVDAIGNPLAAGDIAIVRRGACTFSEKANNAAAAGASAVVIANNNPTSTPWSGMRIWDYTDPVNPILASTFDTACSAASSPIPGCDAAGTYSSHNVIVETQGNKVLAYISWYSDGVLVLDISDPYNPVEVARYLNNEGDVPQDFWGVYKEPNSPFIYAADRSGGLYILKTFGAGSAKNGAKNGKK